ncbi:MAG: radical SAM protein, partial [Candidatus Aenigmarchaeota archaeon]|nr:radical SAM protein [Candidatus Aenigmarchaeota archaeon]
MRLATRLKKRLGRRIKDFYRKEKFVRGVKEDIIRIIKPIRSDIFSFSFSLSTRCNLKCDFCPKTNLGLIKETDIKPEVLEKIYELSSSTVETVKILGIGEPLVYPNFLEVVENLKKHKAKVSFTTNAVLLNEKISKRLCEMNVDEIVFSIQGACRESHEKTKGGSKFDRVIKNVKILSTIKKELNKELPRLCINFV